MAKIPAPPEKLIEASGKPNYGIFTGPIPQVNLDDYDYMGNGRFPFNIAQGLSKLALRRWQYIGVFDEEYVIGVAVVNIGFTGSAFAYVYNRATKVKTEINLIDPGARNSVFSPDSMNGFSMLRKERNSVRIDAPDADGMRMVTVDSDKLKLKLAVEDAPDRVTPMGICCRIGLRRFNYTHKVAGLPASGEIVLGGETLHLSHKALGVFDWTAGVPNRETFWNWASAAGRLDDGQVVALNFGRGLNESAVTENVFWVDGKPEWVGMVHFDYDHKNLQGPWKLTSNDGLVDLEFTPEGERAEEINMLLVRSNFHQPFGKFTGTLKKGTKKIKIDDMFGFVEEHYVKW